MTIFHLSISIWTPRYWALISQCSLQMINFHSVHIPWNGLGFRDGFRTYKALWIFDWNIYLSIEMSFTKNLQLSGYHDEILAFHIWAFIGQCCLQMKHLYSLLIHWNSQDFKDSLYRIFDFDIFSDSQMSFLIWAFTSLNESFELCLYFSKWSGMVLYEIITK